VNGVVDEDEAGEDAEVEDEPGEQIRFGVAGVDLATQREASTSNWTRANPSPEPLDDPGRSERIGVQRQGYQYRRERLAPRERSPGERGELAVSQGATDPPTRDTYRITVLNEQSV